MNMFKGKGKPPAAVEKRDGVVHLKPDNTSSQGKHAVDLAALSQGGLKVDELADIVKRLMERVKELEEG